GLLERGECDAVSVEGRDLLRSDYADRRAERQRLMDIYGPHPTIPEAYTDLARRYLARVSMPEADFLAFAERLFENFRRTARARGIPADPPRERFEPLSSLFRAVDCANPVVDFEGAVLLAADPAILPEAKPPLRVAAAASARASGDGPRHLEEISS